MPVLSETSNAKARLQGLLADPAMSFLSPALTPAVHNRLEALPWFEGKTIRIRGIRALRHKPGRRCLIEYDIEIESTSMTIMGKVRAKGLGDTFEVHRLLWSSGFNEDSPDLISVPEPIGVIPEFHMSLQRKVDGITGGKLLLEGRDTNLASRIAEAINKLHISGVPASRRHTIDDELGILKQRFFLLSGIRPDLALRLNRLLDDCRKLAKALPESNRRKIHRDFYQDQILVKGSRIYLLDFDLFAKGDPALDAGNFIGHLTELSLRNYDDCRKLKELEDAFETRFLEVSGVSPKTVEGYALLTLARHISLCSKIPERSCLTEQLLDLCEIRFGTFLNHQTQIGSG
jgi:hypothetical protein